jgi:hypothetical protein
MVEVGAEGGASVSGGGVSGVCGGGGTGRKSRVLALVAFGLGAIGSALGMQLVPPALRLQIVSGMIAGTLVALVPFFVARRRGHPALASWALLAGLVAGTTFGLLLAVPVAVAFLLAALYLGAATPAAPPAPEP